MNRFVIALSSLAAAFCITAQAAPTEVPIWPNQTGPGSETLSIKQTITERSKDPTQPNRAVAGITRPTLTVYAPAKPNGVAVIIAPGGAYVREGIDNEGADVAVPFNAAGVTVFVLQYRLPAEGHFGSNGKDGKARDVPLADAQRAIRFVRANAAQWNINPAKVGVMGFSAGGHVAASLGTKHASAIYPAQDSADKLSAKPDFMLLVYPVITMSDTGTHKGSRDALLGLTPSAQDIADYSLENKVSAETPATFIALAGNDGSVQPHANSFAFQQKLVAQKVSVELHAFPDGGHGFGIKGAAGKRAAAWPQLAIDWLASIGMK